MGLPGLSRRRRVLHAMIVAQDPDYLLPAVEIAKVALADGNNPDDETDAVLAVFGALNAAGWKIVSPSDWENLIGAYVLQSVR